MTQEFKKFQTVVFFGLLIIMIGLFLWIIRPYIYPLFWATVFAIVFAPVYKKILSRTKQKSLSAGLTVLIIVLLVIIPLLAVLGLVVQQTITAYSTITNPQNIANIQHTITDILELPTVQEIAIRFDLYNKLESVMQSIASTGIQWLTVGSLNTVTAIVQFVIMLYSLYYLLKDGEHWLKRFWHLIPLGEENEKILTERFISTTKATLKGSILIGIGQGLTGGIVFALIGIPAAAFWGLIMIIAAMIPAVGTAFVWVPTALYLFATQQWAPALILSAAGLAMGTFDNVIRPSLVGKDVQMHPVVILFSTLGGIGVFGISGVVIGPIIAGFLISVLSMYEQRYEAQL
ncbi:MAG: AI-2E family transporter [Candidatus Kerfeldbacteria bacterium]|nr:AI-2E family transporter [Candidatus Kerfeldbacteria bacterium]